MDTLSQKFIRKRKLMMALPVLILPFTTLLFWASGGGQTQKTKKDTPPGLDLTLPSPQIKSGMQDKLSLYELAEQRSQKLKDDRAYDPYGYDTTKSIGKYYAEGKENDFERENSSLSELSYRDENHITETKLREQLSALDKKLSIQADHDRDTELPELKQENISATEESLTDVDISPSPTTEPDPQLQQLDNMLSKILDIQHPERITNQFMERSQTNIGLVYPVQGKPDIPQSDLLRSDGSDKGIKDSTYLSWHESGNSFYESGFSSTTQTETAITAVVHETQSLVSGATVKLRLTNDLLINGQQVPSGTFIYGICSLEGERLTVSIKHIHYKNTLLPINLSVYDMDGLEGIRIPGAISKDEAKQGISRGIESLDLYNMNPSFGAQAASAGIQTVKSLLGGKVKLVKATVPAGYTVWLIDNNKSNPSLLKNIL